MPAEEKNDDEPSTSNYKRLTEPEHLVGNGIAPYLRVDVNVEELVNIFYNLILNNR